ncbi:hypothetical protein RI056_06555 [Komagataeibacter nataicola]|nr:hypothetical protein [Komagataeibacter nataicola]WNM09587.1 hypothetical protein RI056_06555 [Komagataeibacter nataicola]
MVAVGYVIQPGARWHVSPRPRHGGSGHDLVAPAIYHQHRSMHVGAGMGGLVHEVGQPGQGGGGCVAQGQRVVIQAGQSQLVVGCGHMHGQFAPAQPPARGHGRHKVGGQARARIQIPQRRGQQDRARHWRRVGLGRLHGGKRAAHALAHDVKRHVGVFAPDGGDQSADRAAQHVGAHPAPARLCLAKAGQVGCDYAQPCGIECGSRALPRIAAVIEAVQRQNYRALRPTGRPDAQGHSTHARNIHHAVRRYAAAEFRMACGRGGGRGLVRGAGGQHHKKRWIKQA